MKHETYIPNANMNYNGETISINVPMNGEEMTRLAKALEIKFDAVTAKYGTGALPVFTTWEQFDNASDTIKTAILEKMVWKQGFRSVRMIWNHTGDACDYYIMNNIGYVFENHETVVSELFIRLATYYRAKYPNNYRKAIRCASLSALMYCIRKDHDSRLTALEKVNPENGESYFVCDTETRTHDGMQTDTEREAILNVTIDRMTERESICAKMYMDGYTLTEIGKSVGVSHTMVRKILQGMGKYFD